MRTIKFRGKDKAGNWIYGGVNADQSAIVFKYLLTAVNPETVGQFTEFYDCDGMEIYEGDILHYTANNACVIVKDFKDFISVYRYISDKFKVVGNIFDNPELLEKKL